MVEHIDNQKGDRRFFLFCTYFRDCIVDHSVFFYGAEIKEVMWSFVIDMNITSSQILPALVSWSSIHVRKCLS